MNALELADRIEKSPYAEYKSAKEAAIVLRQQQAEIEAYKNLVKAQDEKIVELAFRAVYAERGNEVEKELRK